MMECEGSTMEQLIHVKKSKRERKERKAQTALIKYFTSVGVTAAVSMDATYNVFLHDCGGSSEGACQTGLEALLAFHGGGHVDVIMPRALFFAIASFPTIEMAERACTALNGTIQDSVGGRVLTMLYASDDAVAMVRRREGCMDCCSFSEDENIRLPHEIPGLILIPNFISECEEAELVDNVETRHNRWQDIKNRKVQHYGFRFDYSENAIDFTNSGTIGDSDCLIDEKDIEFNGALGILPSFVGDVVQRVMSTGHLPYLPNQLTVNEYAPGQGIPSHVESTNGLDEVIVSLSLLSDVVMSLRHVDSAEVCSLRLPRRSLLVLLSDARYKWSHGIAAATADFVEGRRIPRERRISLTFRHTSTGVSDCTTSSAASALEQLHVHGVYDNIASHFSNTRHAPWPRIAGFLAAIPEGSTVLDVGCGNGKYLVDVPFRVHMEGCDASANLLSIARSRGHNVCVANALVLPYRSACFDVVISIAVLHHLSSDTRRYDALVEMARVLRPGGRLLVYVWALEQDVGKREFDHQDVFVPWKHKVRQVDIHSNQNAKHQNKKEIRTSDLEETTNLNGVAPATDNSGFIYQRFYHVFRNGELDALLKMVGCFTLEDSYYDHANWVVIARKL